MMVGSRVSTLFSGRRTYHHIVERRENAQCQGRVLVRVTPDVPGSIDPDNIFSAEGWLSICWFTPAPEQMRLVP